jgi:polar amino acid transport system substrate-binding protein
MKKLIALVLAAVMAFGMFAGCTPVEEAPAGTNKYNLTTVKEGYLTVVTSPDYAPYEFYALDENGKPELAGFDMYLAQYIANYLGLTLDVVTIDFNGVIGEMGNGSADLALAGLSPEPERLEKMDFSEIYYGGKQAFITTTDKAAQFPDLAAANKAGISVGAQSGTIQQELAEQYSADAELVTLVKATEIIAELVEGKLDGAYIEWDVAESYKKQYPSLHIVAEVPYEKDGNVVGVAKGNTELMKYVNEAIKQCVESGTFAQYLEKANALAAGEKYEGVLYGEGNVPTDEGVG